MPRFKPGCVLLFWKAQYNELCLISAQLLSVVILLVLALIVGPHATHLSNSIDDQSLAYLAATNPRGVCINASREPMTGYVYFNSTLSFTPSLTALPPKWPEFRTAVPERLGHELFTYYNFERYNGNLAPSLDLSQYPIPELERQAALAMIRCGTARVGGSGRMQYRGWDSTASILG